VQELFDEISLPAFLCRISCCIKISTVMDISQDSEILLDFTNDTKKWES